MEQTLLYSGTRRLPSKLFSKEDIKLLMHTLEQNDTYRLTPDGEFYKMRDKTILTLIYLLALRPREACKIRFEDFDLDEMTVKIRGINNKTNKDRVLPIPEESKAVLKRYLSFPDYLWRGSKFIFPSRQGEVISASRWKAIFREKVLKPAGIWTPPVGKSRIPMFRSYTLRHTKATELLNKSKDLYLVANVLGHSSLNSTKVYLHKNRDYMNYIRRNL